MVLSADAMKGQEAAHGEYYGLLLLAASGMMLLVESLDLITFFISLEVLSLALYALSGLLRRDARSNEASIKYFVMGAFASGFVLYGMALLYGATGTLSIPEIGQVLAQKAPAPALVAPGFVLLTIGLAFKVGAVPFHQWVPDVYEGADGGDGVHVGGGEGGGLRRGGAASADGGPDGARHVGPGDLGDRDRDAGDRQPAGDRPVRT